MKDLKEKDENFIDGKMKAVAIGGLYYFNKKVNRAMKGRTFPDRYYIMVKSADKIIEKKEWSHMSKGVAHHAIFALCGICTLDNAYGTFFDEWRKEYEDGLKKAGLK